MFVTSRFSFSLENQSGILDKMPDEIGLRLAKSLVFRQILFKSIGIAQLSNC